MITDFSVAPEIAQLANPLVPAQHATAVPRTDGRIAGDLVDLAAAPERWWDLVRFDERGPLRIPLPDAPGTWLLVLPPGTTTSCDCYQATALAGEAVEITRAGMSGAASLPYGRQRSAQEANRPLRPDRVHVHGALAPHRISTVGHGYSVTLHVSPLGD